MNANAVCWTYVSGRLYLNNKMLSLLVYRVSNNKGAAMTVLIYLMLKSTYDVILLFEHSIIFQEWSVRKVGQPLFWYIEKHAIKEWKSNTWFECTKFSFYFYTVKVYFKWVNVLVSLHSLKAMCLGPFGASAPLLLRNGAILVH